MPFPLTLAGQSTVFPSQKTTKRHPLPTSNVSLPQAQGDHFIRFAGSDSKAPFLKPDKRFWESLGIMDADWSRPVADDVSFRELDRSFLKDLMKHYSSDRDNESLKGTRVYGTLPIDGKNNKPLEPPYTGSVGTAHVADAHPEDGEPLARQILGKHIVAWSASRHQFINKIIGVDRSRPVLERLSFKSLDPDFLEKLIQHYDSELMDEMSKKTRVYGTLPPKGNESKPPYKGTVGLDRIDGPGQRQILGRHIADWKHERDSALPV